MAFFFIIKILFTFFDRGSIIVSLYKPIQTIIAKNLTPFILPVVIAVSLWIEHLTMKLVLCLENIIHLAGR